MANSNKLTALLFNHSHIKKDLLKISQHIQIYTNSLGYLNLTKKNLKTKTRVLFVDLLKAFDCVNREKLFRKLY